MSTVMGQLVENPAANGPGEENRRMETRMRSARSPGTTNNWPCVYPATHPADASWPSIMVHFTSRILVEKLFDSTSTLMPHSSLPEVMRDSLLRQTYFKIRLAPGCHGQRSEGVSGARYDGQTPKQQVKLSMLLVRRTWCKGLGNRPENQL